MFITKKFYLLLLFFFVIPFQISAIFSADAEEKIIKSGILSLSGTTEQEFQEGFDKFREFAAENLSSDNYFMNSIITERRDIKFHDSIMNLLTSLKSGKIDEIILPSMVGDYVMNINKTCEQRFLMKILFSSMSFGFKEDREELKNEFDSVITEMKNDGTLEKLAEQYISNFNISKIKSITPEKFNNVPEIRIAVTGDMPPVDMFAGDGKPAGYNTAVLSEIGRRLKKNIKLVSITAGGRSAALASGKADVVFWYRTTESSLEGDDPLDYLFKDTSEGVILSIPYYSWEEEVIIIAKQKKGIFNIFK